MDAVVEAFVGISNVPQSEPVVVESRRSSAINLSACLGRFRERVGKEADWTLPPAVAGSSMILGAACAGAVVAEVVGACAGAAVVAGVVLVTLLEGCLPVDFFVVPCEDFVCAKTVVVSPANTRAMIQHCTKTMCFKPRGLFIIDKK